jgi:hypothetical protein
MVLLKLQELREILYSLLLATHEDGDDPVQDVRAYQNMGINMTKAVQREGVNIIQLQSVKAIGKITQHTVQALKEVDALEAGYASKFLEGPDYRDRPEPMQLEAPEEDRAEVAMAEAAVDYEPTMAEALKELCAGLAGAGCSLQDTAHVIKYGMVIATLERFSGDIDKTGMALGIKPSYVKALRGRVPEVIKEADDG